MDEWSNNACLGYIVAALTRKGWTHDQIKTVVGAVHTEFDFKTVDEARCIYEQSDY
ncbi:hypothetical protein ['Paenibacillus yunnanensis' Narsing Rao et al. 2020]|uniref:hypothetical protein n=1 Tax=Paenibacillus tengchongensis TaxID=2608684 RepID=UPI001651F617|nr:hypothetical protein [Paenibacillus tengchongensis]